MPELSNLTRPKPTTTEIDLGEGDLVKVTFDRNKITPAWMREAEKRDNERDTFSLPKSLADVIMVWDVTLDGEPFPSTPENIAVLSYPAQQGLLTKILEAAMPTESEGNASGGVSSSPATVSEAALPTSPNGQATFPSPEPSASPSLT